MSSSPYPQQLIDRPWDREAQSVFADQLTATSDPTGEFLALSLSLTDWSLAAARRGWQVRRRLAELEPRLTSALRHRTALEGLTGAELGLDRGLVSFIWRGSGGDFSALWRKAAELAPIRKATLFLHENEPPPAAEMFEKLDTLHLEAGTLDRLPLGTLPLNKLRDFSINGDVPAGWRWPGPGALEALRFGSDRGEQPLARPPLGRLQQFEHAEESRTCTSSTARRLPEDESITEALPKHRFRTFLDSAAPHRERHQ